MPKVDPNSYGGDNQSPALTPDVLGNIDVAVLTVQEFRDPDVGGRKAPLLEFAEYPDHAFWLNKSGIVAICAKLGNDSDKWTGKLIPLLRVRTQNPRTKEYVYKMHVAPVGEWDSILDENEAAQKAPPRKRSSK